ncbi:MAG: translocation/assembly module TamB domain-containing protein [Myxococcales bacterium]
MAKFAVGLVVGLVLLVVAALVVATQVPTLRDRLAAYGVKVLHDEAEVDLRFERVERLDPWGAELINSHVSIPWIGLTATVERTRVSFRPWALLKQDVRFSWAKLEGAKVRFGHVVKSASTAAQGGAESDDEESDWRVTLEHVELLRSSVDSVWTQDRVARIAQLTGAFKYVEGPDIFVQRAELSLLAGTVEQLRGHLEGGYRAASGGGLRLQGTAVDAPFELSVRFAAWDASWEPVALDGVHLEMRGVDRRVLQRLGLAEGRRLQARVDLRLSLRRKDETIHGDLRLRGGGTVLRARANYRARHISGSLDLSAASLGALVSELPAQAVRGEIHADYQFGARAQHLNARWNRWSVGASVLPSGRVQAHLRGRTLHVEQLELNDLGGSLTGSGTYDRHSGAAYASLKARAISLGAVSTLLGQPFQGALTGELQFARSRHGHLSTHAKFVVGGPKLGESLRANRVVAELNVTGSVGSPQAQVAVSVDRLTTPKLEIPSLSVQAMLDGVVLRSSIRASGQDVEAHGVVHGTLSPWFSAKTFTTSLSAEFAGSVHGRSLSLLVPDIRYAAGAFAVRGLSLRSGRARLDANGLLGAHGELAFRLDTSDFALELLSPLLPGLAGALDGRAVISGDLEHPNVSLWLTAHHVQAADAPPLRGTLALDVNSGSRQASAQLSLRGGKGLVVDATAEYDWPAEPAALKDALLAGHGRLYVTANGPLSDLPPPMLPVAGALGDASVQASLNVEGNPLQPSGFLTVSLRDQTFGRPQVHAEALLTGNGATLELHATDFSHPEPQLEGRLDLALPVEGLAALQGLPPSVHMDLHWRIDALDALQGMLGKLVQASGLALPMQTAGAVTFVRENGSNKGSLQMTADARSSAFDTDCGAELQTSLIAQADLDDMRLRGSLSASTSRGGDAFFNLVLPSAWIWDWPDEPGSAQATLDGSAENLPLYAMPGLCNLNSGQAGFELAAVLPAGGPPDVDLNLRVEGLTTASSKPISGSATLRNDAHHAELALKIVTGGKERGSLQATLPLRFRGVRPGISLNSPLDMHLRVANLMVAPLLEFTSAVGRGGGTFSGDVRVTGSVRQPVPHGYLVFDDVAFTVASLAQPVRGIHGRVDFAGDTLTLTDVSARDRNGRLYLEGKAKLLPGGRAEAKLKLRAENVPVRRQGQIMGSATLGADLAAHLDQQSKLSVEAFVRSATFQFSGSTGKAVQELEPHPDVRMSDAPEQALSVERKQGESGFALQTLEIRSKQDLWLKHRDFRVQLGLDLALQNIKGKDVLVGEATIVQGNLKLLGKSFNIQRGTVRFLEDSDEPQLDLRASYEPPGGQSPLFVEVSGRASSPALNFSGAASDAEQAFAILSGMGAAEAAVTAQADANAFGLGLTAGLLSMTARERLGAWVPTVSVGSNSRGEASQARAGFDATSMIPPFLRGVARGAYVEGVVGNTQNGGPGGNVGLGVRFEIALPRSTMVTFGYGPGTMWSADVAWLP